MARIAPPERDVPLAQRHQSVIAHRHAMGIAPQGRDNVLRGGKRWLGIDDPGLLPEWREKTLEGPGIPQGCCGPRKVEAVLGSGLLQGGEVLPAKHLGEGFDRKEKVTALGRNPAGPPPGLRPRPSRRSGHEYAVPGFGSMYAGPW